MIRSLSRNARLIAESLQVVLQENPALACAISSIAQALVVASPEDQHSGTAGSPLPSMASSSIGCKQLTQGRKRSLSTTPSMSRNPQPVCNGNRIWPAHRHPCTSRSAQSPTAQRLRLHPRSREAHARQDRKNAPQNCHTAPRWIRMKIVLWRTQFVTDIPQRRLMMNERTSLGHVTCLQCFSPRRDQWIVAFAKGRRQPLPWHHGRMINMTKHYPKILANQSGLSASPPAISTIGRRPSTECLACSKRICPAIHAELRHGPNPQHCCCSRTDPVFELERIPARAHPTSPSRGCSTRLTSRSTTSSTLTSVWSSVKP